MKLMETESTVGRPEHKPTPASRKKIILRAANNWSQKNMALELGITVPTLTKHYMIEIETGWVRMCGENLDRLSKSAKNGNVSAQKFLQARLDRSNPDFATPDGSAEENGESAQTGAYVSKKATAQARAEEADKGRYATPPAPGKAVN